MGKTQRRRHDSPAVQAGRPEASGLEALRFSNHSLQHIAATENLKISLNVENLKTLDRQAPKFELLRKFHCTQNRGNDGRGFVFEHNRVHSNSAEVIHYIWGKTQGLRK